MPKEKIKDDAITLASETLTGDVRDAILNQIRTLQKPYARCTHDEQQGVIEHATKVAANLVEQAVSIIASHGRTVIHATLDGFNLKGGIKASVKCANTQSNLLELGAADGKAVFIVVADSEQFTGEQGVQKPESDQGVIPLHLAKDEE